MVNMGVLEHVLILGARIKDIFFINNYIYDPSSYLDVTGANGGLLIPRMTKAQRVAIVNPAPFLQVIVTDNGGYMNWYNSGWQKVSSVAD